MNSIENIKNRFISYLQQTFSINTQQMYNFQLSLNTDPDRQQFGDLTSTAPLLLAKQLGKPPRTIAQQIITEFTHPLIAKTEIAGPGFINFYLTTQAWQTTAQELHTNGKAYFELSQNEPRYNYNIEFISANPTGPLHLGHGRGGIIGDVLGNILRFLGHQVTKEFYVNDAGTQMQKLGKSFKIRIAQELGQPLELLQDGYQGSYLVDLAKACIAQYGPEVIQQNDQFFITYAHDHLLAQQKETLKTYGIYFDIWFSEKELHQSGAIERSLAYLQKSNQTYTQEGALWFKSTEYGDDKDRVLKKANGELTYVAADIAYMKDKIDRGANHLVMTLGQDHHSYVVRLHGLQKALGLEAIPFDIILYQLVSLKEGGEQLRMSKRAGRMVTLHEIIELVGPDVARFFYLHRKADAHLEFDLDLALKKTDENPVYYVQYAFVRTKSILEKAEIHPELQYISNEDALHMTKQETILLKKIVTLKELLSSITQNHQTHLLTYYVIELANLFHAYYAKHRVIDLEHIPESRARLLMIKLMSNTFETVLKLLGITRPNQM